MTNRRASEKAATLTLSILALPAIAAIAGISWRIFTWAAGI